MENGTLLYIVLESLSVSYQNNYSQTLDDIWRPIDISRWKSEKTENGIERDNILNIPAAHVLIIFVSC